jgi:parvulin-like peptidyl-prolyl isomerase
MSKGVIWVSAIALILVGGFSGVFNGFGSLFNKGEQVQTNPEDVIAKVNGDPITRSSYEQALSEQQRQMEMYGGSMTGPLSAGELHVSALNRVIGQQLMIQIAKKAGLEATSKDIDATREKHLTDIKQQLGLKPTASQSSVEAEMAKVGQSLDRFLPADRLATEALMDKYQKFIERSARPSDQAVDAYYTGMHTQHILVENKKRPDAQAKDQATKIIAQLNAAKGANFEALAKQYSDDPGTKAKGGDDGWINGTTGYVEEFMNGARVLKPGEWSQTPVLAPQFGYFIIKLIGTRDDKPKDFATKREDYVKQIGQAAVSRRQQTDMEAAQKAMKVEVSDPQLDGDWKLLNAFKNAGQGSKPSVADANIALAAYDKALKVTKDHFAVAQMQAQKGILYRVLDKPDDQLKAFVAAETATENMDPDLALQIGDLYKKKKDTANALTYFKIASKYSYDNPGTHSQLLQFYKELNKPEEVAIEQAWLAKYQAQQKANAANSPMGGQPLTVKSR